MQIQMRDMEYFAAIAKHGQVQRAAAALGLSQPALSKSLKRLEQTLKTSLLKRTPKGVELTSVGKALLSHIDRMRLTLTDIAREATDLSEGRTGQLHVGTGPDLALTIVPYACAALLKDAPMATLRMTAGTADVLLPALSRGEMDLSVNATPLAKYDDLAHEPVIEEQYLVYCSSNHRLAKKKGVTLADLTGEKWTLADSSASLLQQDLHQIFAAEGLPAPKVAVETNSVAFRTLLLPSTDLLGFLPKRAIEKSPAREQLTQLKIKGLSYQRTISICYRKDAYISPIAQRFIDTLKATARAIL